MPLAIRTIQSQGVNRGVYLTVQHGYSGRQIMVLEKLFYNVILSRLYFLGNLEAQPKLRSR